jgi:hypothetical protein
MRVIQAGRFESNRLLGENDPFGIASASNADDAKNLVADIEPGRLRAALFDNTGDVAPQRVGQSILLHGWVLAIADLEIDWIDARRFDFD